MGGRKGKVRCSRALCGRHEEACKVETEAINRTWVRKCFMQVLIINALHRQCRVKLVIIIQLGSQGKTKDTKT